MERKMYENIGAALLMSTLRGEICRKLYMALCVHPNETFSSSRFEFLGWADADTFNPL